MLLGKELGKRGVEQPVTGVGQRRSAWVPVEELNPEALLQVLTWALSVDWLTFSRWAAALESSPQSLAKAMFAIVYLDLQTIE